MVNKKWVYVVSKRTQNMRKAQKLSNVCNYCEINILVGEKIYSRNSSSKKSKSKIYHINCAKKVNIV